MAANNRCLRYSASPFLFQRVKPRPCPHSGIFDRSGQSGLTLPKGDRSIDGVMEQWSSDLGEKSYMGFGSYHSLLKMPSIALFSIIPLLHHSLAQTWFYRSQYYSGFFCQTATPSGSSVQVAPGQAIPPEKLWDDRQSS